MMRAGAKAELYLNDVCVGEVNVVSSSPGWGFGEFKPNKAFSQFAPIFGRWSLLLHAQGEGERLDEAAHEELREAECELDGLRARLLEAGRQQWHALGQVNIDGPLVEWKEY